MITLTESKHTRPWSWICVLHKCEKSNFYYFNHGDSLELLIADVYRHLCMISFGMFTYAFDVCSFQAWKTSKVFVYRWVFFLSISFSLFTIFICVFTCVGVTACPWRARVLERPISSLFLSIESQLQLGLGGKRFCGLSHLSICSLCMFLNYNNKISTGKSMKILKHKCGNHPYNLISSMEHLYRSSLRREIL